MNRQWYIRQQLEMLASPTSVQYHRIDVCSSIVQGVRRVRRILADSRQTENDKLIRACWQNDVETVTWLLGNADGHETDLKRGINRSVLHEAALHRDGSALVRVLCQHGADPKQRDPFGRTPFHYAASLGHLDVLIELLHFTPAPVSSLVDREGRCPLMYACGEGHLSVCQWLTEYGDADYERLDDQGRSCLTYACRNGYVEVVEWLLPILSPESTKTGWHPLHFACSNGHVRVMQVLLRHDAQAAHALINTGHSALFLAMHAETNAAEMIKCLLDFNPTIRLTSRDITDLNCDKSLVFLLAQRAHRLEHLVEVLEQLDYFFPLLHLLLLSEHTYCRQKLLSAPQHQAFIRHRLQNPLKLKQILRCSIRKSSNHVDLLEITQSLKKFLRFESLY